MTSYSREIIQLSDAEIEARFDNIGASICVSDLVFVDTTIDDFKSGRVDFSEPGHISRDRGGELVIDRVQVSRGRQRGDLYVIDFGSCRAAYGASILR